MNLIPAGLLEGVGSDGQIAGFRPEHVDLGDGPGERVRFNATVEVVEYLGDEQLAHLRLNESPVQAKLSVEERLENGAQASFSIPRDKLRLFDAETEQRVAA
jgi:ABC-type sugar transport system ATPase subunit